jgi:3-hydroxyacyl-[acyl-carrier-protein] dehydratase
MSNRTGEVSFAEIQRFTPHRYPLLLLDRGQEFEPFRRMVGIKAISVNEPWFRGRRSGDACFPDVLILEAMGQVGGVMMSKSLGADQAGKTVAFIAMDNVRFLRRVRPGDVLHMPVTVTKYRENFFRYHAEAYVDGRLVAECDFSGVAIDAAIPA